MDMEYYKKYEPLFGSYYIKKFLGEGSFGKVFLIEREDFGMKYDSALKVITVPQSKSDLNSKLSYMTEENAKSYYEDIVNGIVSEFHLMWRLKGNSYIVSYIDHKVIEHEDSIGWDILICMELLTPLQQQTDLQAISPEEVVRLGIDISKALGKCQKEDIIHRDIKPENIFISADGNYKLGDFGVARTIEKTTGDFTRIGTPPYMAPEIHSGNQYASCIDIYSLGLVMYRLLNKNRMPFLPAFPDNIEPGDEEVAVSKRISGEEMPNPINADKKLAEIVLKACAFKAENRYQKPAELREELEKYQREHESISAGQQKIEGESNDTVQKNDIEPDKPQDVPEAPVDESIPKTAPKPYIQNLGSNRTEVLMHSKAASQEPAEQEPPVMKERTQRPSRRSPRAEQGQVKIGYIKCSNCGAEIRRESISCISCRKQLRRV